MKKTRMLILSLLLVLLSIVFVGCVKNSGDEQEQKLDIGELLELRTSDGFKEVVLKKEILGSVTILKGCDEFNVEVENEFHIIEEKNDSLILSIANGNGIVEDSILFRVPDKTEIVFETFVTDLNPAGENAKKRNGDIPVILGDFNYDSFVNLDDFMLFKYRYNKNGGDSGYSEKYDIYPAEKTFSKPKWQDIYSQSNPDWKIDIYDFILFTLNYRKSVNRAPVIELTVPESVNASGESTISCSLIDYDNNDVDFSIKIFEDDIRIKNATTTMTPATTKTTDTCHFKEGKEYRFVLNATDIVNESATTAATELTRTVNINIKPSISKVTENKEIVNEESLTFEWYCSDPDGDINYSEYRLDDEPWETTTSSSYTISGYSKGEHTFYARSIDDRGGVSEIISWHFLYYNNALQVKYHEKKLYINGSGLTNVKGIQLKLDYDSDICDLGEISLNDSINAEILSDASYTVDIGFWNTQETIQGSIASIEVNEITEGSTVGIEVATVVSLMGEDLVNSNPDLITAEVPVLFKNTVWQKWYGGSGHDRPGSIQPTADGGYLVTGTTESTECKVNDSTDDQDAWIIKLDNKGEMEWDKTLGGSSEDAATATPVYETDDGGFIVAGTSDSNDGAFSENHGNSDFWVFKLSAAGDLEWQELYGGSDEDGASYISGTSDGNYIVAGTTRSNDGDVSGNHGNRDYWVIKINGNGDLLWQQPIGGSSWDYRFSIDVTNDGGAVIAGESDDNDPTNFPNNNGSDDYLVVKLGTNGDVEWQDSYGGSSYERPEEIKQTSDGGFIVVGYSDSSNGDVSGNNGSQDFWILKLEENGDIQWDTALGGTEYERANAVIETSDGGFVIAGRSSSSNYDVDDNYGSDDFWVVKLNSNGAPLWKNNYGGTSNDYAENVFETADNGLIVTGSTHSNDIDVSGNHGNQDHWIIKLNSEGTLLWQNPIGGPEYEYNGLNLHETNDGNYIFAFSLGSYWHEEDYFTGVHGKSDYWIVKISDE